jgi:predicted AlkP superfamily phosphohydrolase/phosphomutase
MHAGIGGFLYFNLKGRQPTGIVEPSEYEALRDELIARFLGEECKARNPQGEWVSLFSEVHRPEEVYGCTREAQPWLPDLILIPRPSLSVVRRLRGDTVVKWSSYRRMEGTHRQDGIFLATGPGIAHQEDVRAHIVDCAPTALAMIGQSIPEDIEGRVITEAFIEPPVVKTASVAADTVTPMPTVQPTAEAYSEDDLKKVTERLSDLGYLE